MKINYKIKEVQSLTMYDVSLYDIVMFDKRLCNSKHTWNITTLKMINKAFYYIKSIDIKHNLIEVVHISTEAHYDTPMWTSIDFFSKKIRS